MQADNNLLYQQFQEVFEQYYNALCNYALTFLKEFSSSEDVVQEVFIKIWEKRKDMVTSDAIRFYLFTAVRNNCLTYLQKGKKAGIVALHDFDAADTPPPVLEEEQPQTDYKAKLSEAMNQLPPKCREVFVLSRLSKQSYKEIADSLDISVKTVENQIGKALKILRAYAHEHKIFLTILIVGILNLSELSKYL